MDIKNEKLKKPRLRIAGIYFDVNNIANSEIFNEILQRNC